MNHSCLKTEYRATDWIRGVNSPLNLSGTSINDWQPFFHFKERQDIDFETDDCVIFSASEITDAEIDYLISVGKIPQATLDYFTSAGFMDSVNSDDSKPHFHSSPRFWSVLTGNGQNGNNLYDPWDVARKYGAIPWTDLPFDSTITTPEQYFAPIPQNLLDKGALFLAQVGGKNWIQYHWISNNNGTMPFAQIDLDRYATPLHIGINVGGDWNEVNPPLPAIGLPAGHSVTNIANSEVGEVIYDHYNPFIKTLLNGYPIPQVMQAVVTITPPPPIPTLPPTPTVQQESNWLTQLVAWLNNLFPSLTGLVKKVQK